MHHTDPRQTLDTLLRVLMLTFLLGTLLAGIGTALWGWRQTRRDGVTERDRRRCGMLLDRWGYFRASRLWPVERTPVPEELALNLRRLGAWQSVVGGVGVALGSLAALALVQVTTGDLLSMTTGDAIAVMMLPVLVAAVTVGPAARFAARKASVLTEEAPEPLPHRRSWLSLVPALLVLSDAALMLFLAPRVLMPFSRPDLSAPVQRLPAGLAQVCAVALVVAFAASEYTVRLLVQLPRLRLIDDSVLAARIDGNWRTWTIRTGLVLTYLAMGEVGIGVSFVFLTFAGDIPTLADLIGLYALFGLTYTEGWVCLLVAWRQGRLRLWPPKRTAPALDGLDAALAM